MTHKRLFFYGVFLLLLPVFVAALGLSVTTAVLLALVMLIWRWLIVLSGIRAPEQTPALILETISASHFVEKVRWCMDRLGIDYVERQSGGVLGFLGTGRTVPQLRVRTGLVQSVIGNSPEILRYLWGTQAAVASDAARFLEPSEERLQFERKLDRYARSLQVWIYYHLLNDRELTLHAWGVDSPHVPVWHRFALRALFPLLARFVRGAFGISAEHYSRSLVRIEELLSDVDTRLADGRGSILGGDRVNFTDITFAAYSALWLQPQGYAGVQGQYVRINRPRMPAAMRADIQRWLEDFPKATRYVEDLYARER